MNILFIYDSPLCPEVGGTERATKLVMDELGKRGHMVFGLVHASRINPDEWFYNNTKIESLYDFLIENNIDVVVNQIAFNYWLLDSFLKNGGTKWRKSGGKIISFMHLDPTPAPKKKIRRYFDDWKQKTIIGKIKRVGLMFYLPFLYRRMDKEYAFSMRYLYDNSDRYILMSRSFTGIFSELAERNVEDKVRYITNMLTFPDIEDKSVLDKKSKMVLVVARMDDEQKNISFILDIWRKIKCHNGYTLHIVGSGKDELWLREKAQGLKNVVFEGAQNPLKWYKNARIFLMASPREGWGLTITEGMQCGVVPIVLNTSSVFKDIIIDCQNGFLANNADEYIKYLELLMSDDLLRDDMAINCLESSKRFSPSIVGDKWEEVLTQLKCI